MTDPVREAQKHTDPLDAGPQHSQQIMILVMIFLTNNQIYRHWKRIQFGFIIKERTPVRTIADLDSA